MQIDKSMFQALTAMFAARRSGIDEIEAVMTETSIDVTREIIMRVIKQYTIGLPASARSVTDVLDTQMDSAGGVGGGVLRVSVEGRANIERVLEDVNWTPAVSTAMRKARVRPSVNIPEYRLRINMKEEVPVAEANLQSVLKSIPTMMGKTFRLKRRYSFTLPGKEFRVDITAVRQKTTGAAVPKYEDLLRCAEVYELEIEHLGGGGVGASSSSGGASTSSSSLTAAAVTTTTTTTTTTTNPAAEASAKGLIKHFNVLLKYVDDTTILMSKSAKSNVLNQYVQLVWGPNTHIPMDPRAKARLFVGPKPVTFDATHMRDPDTVDEPDAVLIRAGDYTITDKADGVHRLLYIDALGAAYTIDDRLSIRATGLATTAAHLKNSLIDGEHVGSTDTFMAFDAYCVGGSDIRALPLMLSPKDAAATKAQKKKKTSASERQHLSRLEVANVICENLKPINASNTTYRARAKEFLYIDEGDDIFKQVKAFVLKRDTGKIPYEIDGFIFTPASFAVGASVSGAPPRPWSSGTGRWDQTLKWKPAEFNSIDMLVRLRPEQRDGLVATAKGQVFRVGDLYVGQKAGPFTKPITPLEWATGAADSRIAAAKDPAQNNRYDDVLLEAPGRPECVVPKPYTSSASQTHNTQTQKEEPLHVVHLLRGPGDDKLRCENGQEIFNDTIVEFAFDAGPPCATIKNVNADQSLAKSLARRWRPLRVREDKITPNNIAVAQSVWSTIVTPVTEDMLVGKAPLPDLSEDAFKDMYYARKAGEKDDGGSSDDAKSMRRFHNWVKKDILLMPFGSGKTRSLFDFGVGRAGDLDKWLAMGGVTRVLGIDKFGNNLIDPGLKGGGAFIRALRAKQRYTSGGRNQNNSAFPKLMFIEMDASLPITRTTIEALDDTNGDRTVAKVIWGLVEPVSIPDARLRDYHGFAMGGYDLATCMFAIHYFFQSKDTLATFCKNVANVLRPGGYFVGCCLDGRKVEAMFEDQKLPVDGTIFGGCVGSDDHNNNNNNKKKRCSWKITRKYETPSPPQSSAFAASSSFDPYGRRIDVYVDSIGQTLPEYLVDFALLVRVMAEAGLVPIPSPECKSLGLIGGEATGMFEDAFVAIERRVGPNAAANAANGINGIPKGVIEAVQTMTDDEKRYSFLNRWFAFKKA